MLVSEKYRFEQVASAILELDWYIIVYYRKSIGGKQVTRIAMQTKQ